jgi:hypothetical protein
MSVAAAAAGSTTLRKKKRRVVPADEGTDSAGVDLANAVRDRYTLTIAALGCACNADEASVAMQLGSALIASWRKQTSFGGPADASRIIAEMLGVPAENMASEGGGGGGDGGGASGGASGTTAFNDASWVPAQSKYGAGWEDISAMLSVSKEEAQKLLQRHGSVERCMQDHFDGAPTTVQPKEALLPAVSADSGATIDAGAAAAAAPAAAAAAAAAAPSPRGAYKVQISYQYFAEMLTVRTVEAASEGEACHRVRNVIDFQCHDSIRDSEVSGDDRALFYDIFSDGQVWQDYAHHNNFDGFDVRVLPAEATVTLAPSPGDGMLQVKAHDEISGASGWTHFAGDDALKFTKPVQVFDAKDDGFGPPAGVGGTVYLGDTIWRGRHQGWDDDY